MDHDGSHGLRRMSRDAALSVLARRRASEVVVSTMTSANPWKQMSKNDRNLVCQGFMGGASALGLGIALARPDTSVWVIDGDGSLLMQLASLATVASCAPEKFIHIVMRNDVYETSGNQPLPASEALSFSGIAREAGYPHVARFDDVEEFDSALDDLLSRTGPIFIELLTSSTDNFYKSSPTSSERPTPALAIDWPAVQNSLLLDKP